MNPFQAPLKAMTMNEFLCSLRPGEQIVFQGDGSKVWASVQQLDAFGLKVIGKSDSWITCESIQQSEYDVVMMTLKRGLETMRAEVASRMAVPPQE